MAKSRSEKTYKLPRLTVAEAARVVGTSEGEFWIWLNGAVKPSPSLSSKWANDMQPLPEAIIRLYLTQKAHGEKQVPQPLREPTPKAEPRRRAG